MGRDFLTLGDLPAPDMIPLLERATELATAWVERRMPTFLSGKRISLIVNESGWRNPTAFQLGVSALGGICVPTSIRLDGAEAISDLAAYLDNWFDAAVIRAPDLAVLHSFAEAATVPVINARTRQNHPCETLGDLAYYWSRHRNLDNIKIAFIGPRSNILGSWIEAAETLHLDVVQIFPKTWHDHREKIGGFCATTEMDEARDADIIITDCWPQDGDARQLAAYQVTAEFLQGSRRDVEFIPCPPVTRGQEVSSDAMTHPRCTVTQAKAFLLHGQNALLEWALDATSRR